MEIEETAANPAETEELVQTEAEAPAGGEGEEESSESEVDLSDLLEQAAGANEDNPENVEVEYEGKTYQLPPELRDALLRQSDYTKKTMSLAEERKAVEAIKAEVEQARNASQERQQAEINARLALARVEQLKATVIDGLPQEQINALHLQLRDAEAAAYHWESEAQRISQAEREYVSQHFAKAREQAIAEAAKHIPNFTEARRAELDSFVQSLDGQAGVVADITEPFAWRVLHLADIGAKFIERQRQAGKIKAAQAVKPTPEVGSGKAAAPAKDLVRDADKMSADEWARQRNAQLAKKAGR